MAQSMAFRDGPVPAIRRTDGSGAWAPVGSRAFVGAQIRAARRLVGLGRDRLASEAGIEAASLVAFEHGVVDVPALTMARLAEALGKPLPWFFDAVIGDMAVPVAAPGVGRGAPAGSRRGRRGEDARTRVLLVDDAADVLLVLGAFLEGAGLQVLKAASGDEALRVVTSTVPVHVLVTDSVMPGMSGIDLLHQALQVRPTLPGLLITGYAETLAGAIDLPAGVRVLRKPFRREDLVARVQELAGAASLPEIRYPTEASFTRD